MSIFHNINKITKNSFSGIRKGSLLALAAVALSAGQANAQETKVLSLKECVQYALQNHGSNQIYKNDVQIAKQQGLEALSGYLPQVNGSATVDDNIKRQTTVIPAGAFSPTDIRVQFGNQYMANATLQADQTIYDQSLLFGIKANKPNTEIAELNKQKNDETLIYNTSTAYYQVLILKEQVKLLSENEKKFTDLVAVQKLQYEKGVLKKVDYDRVRVNLNNISNQKKLAEMNLELAINRLKNAMGLPQQSALQVADSLSATEVSSPSPNTQFSMKSLLDYQILNQNIRLQEIDLQRRRAGYIPTLSVYGRYGAQAFGNEFNTAFDNWFDFAMVGVKLNVPVFDGLRKNSQIQQTQLRLLNARERLALSEQNLSLQVQNANTQLLSSYTNLTANKENLALAKDVFENTSLQYKQGVAGLTDLLNADYAYKEAQTNYINSLLNYLIAQLDVEKSKGTLTQNIK